MLSPACWAGSWKAQQSPAQAGRLLKTTGRPTDCVVSATYQLNVTNVLTGPPGSRGSVDHFHVPLPPLHQKLWQPRRQGLSFPKLPRWPLHPCVWCSQPATSAGGAPRHAEDAGGEGHGQEQEQPLFSPNRAVTSFCVTANNGQGLSRSDQGQLAQLISLTLAHHVNGTSNLVSRDRS
jgi:hypothetical protein